MDGELQRTPERHRRLTVRTSAAVLSALMLAIVLYLCTPRATTRPAPDAAAEKQPTLVSYADALQTLKDEDSLYQELNAKRGFLITIHEEKMREYEQAIRPSDDDLARDLNFEKQEEEEEAFRAKMGPIMAGVEEREKRVMAAKNALEEAAVRDAPLLKAELENAQLPLDVEPLVAEGFIERMPGNKFKLPGGSIYGLPLHAQRHVASVERTFDENGNVLSTSVVFEARGEN
jgi:hypothetical protein